ncbi:acyl-CoA dehydrogenase [Vitreoscilla stercoraria]|uniref:Acyl-CoA dehydrogenase n=1 Tax=Vitreoscilla stercoraria TaxID=61 RepID=A0ABY4E9X2_VITST|nr:acyl-CoA dehydrogenase [Vitreoscilla stercoraria]UOO92557.1 acyl-CoA dehydrogenase [Vitreoscilla stercoraria]
MTYKAPLNDLRFALHTHAQLPQILALPKSAGLDDETVNAILDEAAKFAETLLAETNRQGDLNGAKLVNGKVVCDPVIANAFNEFRDAGWVGLRASPDFDGQGLPMTVAAACEEMWCSANLAFSLLPMLTLGAFEALHHHASEAVQQKFMAKMANGEWSGTMNLTEPQAGSDLAQVAAKAKPLGDDTYAITGQKIFITWGDHELVDNIVHLVLARLPDAPAGVKGISLFAVPKYWVEEDGSLGAFNHAQAVSLEHKLGIHASPTCVMSFEESRGYLVGEAGRGLNCMFTMMNHARLGVGIEGHAVAERAYQHALAYAHERVQSRAIQSDSIAPVAIIEHPDVCRMLLQQKATLEAQRAVYLKAAAALDVAESHPVPDVQKQAQALLDFLIPIVKGWSTENGTTLTNLGMQVFGGMGFIEETGAAQYVRDVRITAIYEGTNGIQALDFIGRKTAANGGAVAQYLLDEGRALAAKLPSDSPLVTQLNQALDLAAESVQYVLAQFAANTPNNAAAGSLAYLMQFGFTLGAIEMARAYLAAGQALENESEQVLGEDFYRHKQHTVRAYFDLVLPQVLGLHQQVIRSADSVLDYPAAALAL